MHVDLWFALAKAYMKIGEQKTLEDTESKEESKSEAYFKDYDKQHYVSTSCVRVK